MGECYYYLKAEFATEARAKRAAKKLEKALRETREAHKIRDTRSYSPTPPADAASLWKLVEARFPTAAAIVRLSQDFDPEKPDLSGKLSFCGHHDGEAEVEVYGTEIRYCAEVWHFATWDGLGKWVKEALGAERVAWGSDEDINPFDALQYQE